VAGVFLRHKTTPLTLLAVVVPRRHQFDAVVEDPVHEPVPLVNPA
jgi:hypothetical protein